MIFKFETNLQLTFRTPNISERYQTYSFVCCTNMVSESVRGNSDSYIGKGNTVNKVYTKHTQANKWTIQMDSNMKAFYCPVDFTAEIRFRRLACWDSHKDGH